MICKKGDPPKIISSFFPGIALVMIIGCAPSIRYTNDISEKETTLRNSLIPKILQYQKKLQVKIWQTFWNQL